MEDEALVLARFHVALVASIERSNPTYLRESFRVAEIYEDLIPYRTHRDLIGVAMNGDYEHGVMRLLAGESDYLILESFEAREALQKELAKTAPDTGMFKQYGAEPVRLNPELAGTGPTGSEENTGVAKLFSGKEEPESEATTRWGFPADEPQRPAEDGPRSHPVAAGKEAVAPESKQDAVGSSEQFWMESRKPLKVARDPDDQFVDPPTALEAENRRLKILLAERVLEVEELREQLKRESRRALQGDP
ncbi:MAG: hypothetical protein ACR2QM_07930 [Longimicrobiales bacterium]